jgi:hypothetical protein
LLGSGLASGGGWMIRREICRVNRQKNHPKVVLFLQES